MPEQEQGNEQYVNLLLLYELMKRTGAEVVTPELVAQVTDRLYVGMATYAEPSRRTAVVQALKSLVAQVDCILVHCNGYSTSECDALVFSENIIACDPLPWNDNYADLGKIAYKPIEPGYMFLCDDDLIYPPGYIAHMKRWVDHFDRQAIVGLHGIILKQWPVRSYYRDRTVRHYRQDVHKPVPVHMLGTGCMAFHTDTFQPRITSEMSECLNADIHVGRLAQAQRIPMIRVPLEGIALQDIPVSETIYGRFGATEGADMAHTAVVNKAPWALHDGVLCD